MRICKNIAKAMMLLALSIVPATRLCAQNISEIAKSDPLVITGSVGTQNTYHYSSMGYSYRSPLSNSIYANLNIAIYGFNMPFSLHYTNDNLSFSYPHLSMNLSPTYKNWTGHLGQSSMEMSEYVMSMSFNGVGAEYNDDNWHAGVFYGRLRKAINDDPTNPFARTPQYKRMGWGAKVGYGKGQNYINLYFLRAYDQLKSLDDRWQSRVSPQENIVVGVKGSVSPAKWMSLSANVATSVFSTDTRTDTIPINSSWDKIFTPRYSSLFRFAGDATANFNFSWLNANVSYRLLQPDYKSLGAYYLSNNYHSLGITASTSLFRRINLTGTFSGQADNLSKEQMYTTCGYVYGANASTRLGKVNLTASYNGYRQTQRDGICQVTDSTRVDRRMSSFTFVPSYSLESEVMAHTMNLSLNYTFNKDLSAYANGAGDVRTLAAGLSYGVDVEPWNTDFALSLSHQESRSTRNNTYLSDVASLTASRSFLKEKNFNLSATVSLCHNHMVAQSENMTVGGDLSASYTLKKVHQFSASASIYREGNVTVDRPTAHLDETDISLSLNYVYTFELLHIESRAKRKAAAAKAAEQKQLTQKITAQKYSEQRLLAQQAAE